MDQQSHEFSDTEPYAERSPAEEFERRYVVPAEGLALIVGSRVYAGKEDRRMRYPDALGVDMLDGVGVDIVADLEQPLQAPLGRGAFAHIECISVLEHSRRPWKLAANLERLLRSGGTIHVQAPFVWRPHMYPQDMWRFTVDGLRELFPRIRWHALSYAHLGLTRKNKIPVQQDGTGYPYFGRTEACGFGELIES